jgi:hypothetical protein
MKERNREHLLRMKLGVGLVQDILISRVPMVTANRRIVVFSRITEFSVQADVIVAASEGEFTHV